jgi:hypothetical protein
MTSAPLIANTGLDKAKGMDLHRSGDADAIAYGSLYIANPDLVARFKADAPLSKPDPSTFHGWGPKGLHRLSGAVSQRPDCVGPPRSTRHGPHAECPVREHGADGEYGTDAWCRGHRRAG